MQLAVLSFHSSTYSRWDVIKSTKTHTSSCLGMLNFAIFDLVLAESGLLEGTPLYDLVVSAGNFSFGDSSGA